MERHSFHAMGTDVDVFLDVDGGADAVLALACVERLFDRLEGLMSRFRPESQLSQLNADGRLTSPDPALVEVVELAFEAHERTRGLFDPTVHDALVAAGYDRSFESLATEPPRCLPWRGGARRRPRSCSRGRHLALSPGTRLDLGGIGKGYAVDRAVALLAPLGPCLVNGGGDLAVGGAPRLWPVAVEGLGEVTLGLERGALATSGRDRRRWAGGHHLIDPRTGRPAETDVERVTVAAPTAVEAEVAAKAVFLGGSAEAERLGVPALVVHEDGRTDVVGGLL